MEAACIVGPGRQAEGASENKGKPTVARCTLLLRKESSLSKIKVKIDLQIIYIFYSLILILQRQQHVWLNWTALHIVSSIQPNTEAFNIKNLNCIIFLLYVNVIAPLHIELLGNNIILMDMGMIHIDVGMSELSNQSQANYSYYP